MSTEAAGADNGGTQDIARGISRSFTEATGGQHETFRLLQRLSLAAQHANAASQLPLSGAAH